MAYCQVLPDEEGESACAFLRAAVAYYAALGVTIREVLTDNGVCYRAKNFAATCSTLGLKHRRTRPYTPRTNGKAERFIQTSLREWAYIRAYTSSAERTAAIGPWTDSYNLNRPTQLSATSRPSQD